MSTHPIVPGPIPVENEPNEKKASKKPVRRKAKAAKVVATPKPQKTLPNWRVGVAKQFDILRAYAAGSAKGSKAVMLEEASQIAGLSPSTVIAAMPFLTNIGLLKRAEAG